MPIFNRTPARITLPAVGASTWASGSQVWKGNIGTLMAKDRKKAMNNHFCWVRLRLICSVISIRSVVKTPTVW